MKYAWLILFALISFSSYAEVYKTIDANGEVTYSDKPTDSNSIPVELPKTNTAPSSIPPSNSTSNLPQQTNVPPTMITNDQNSRRPYTKFSISSPVDQETIQNQPNIPITVDVQPNLQDGDLIQIYLDGAPWGNAEHKTSFSFTAPDRGTHVLSATLFDKSMRVLKQSNTNTIYIHQAHLGGAP